MATNKTLVHKIATIPRFTVRDGYHVWSMDVLDTGLLAVAGHSEKKNNSFIDLFMFELDPDSQAKPLLLKPKTYFSQKFTEFGSSWRFVCLLDDCLFLTSCEDTIALYDSSKGGLVNQGKFNGRAACMTTRDGLVYVGLRSNEVIVLYLRELRKKKTITLKGLQGGDFPCDITVGNNRLFICTGFGGRALIYNSEGEVEQQYRNTPHSYARSIAVSEEKGFIFILWFWVRGSQVVVYSLYAGHSSISGGHSTISGGHYTISGGHSSISGGHSSISGDHSSISGGHSSISGGHSSIAGGHILASFKVPDYSTSIRINNNINRLFLVTRITGEVFEYHTSDIFTFDNLLKCLESMTDKNNCKELLDHYEVPDKESEDIIKSDAPFSSLVHHLREAGKVSVDDISHLMSACYDKELSKLVAVLNVYQQTQVTQNVFKDQLKALENKRQELSDKLAESEKETQKLRDELKTLKALLRRENA